MPLYSRTIAISEIIIYFSNIGKMVVNTPFHYELVLQLHRKFGSKFLIDNLDSFRICVSYDELRRFLTAMAQEEIKRSV